MTYAERLAAIEAEWRAKYTQKDRDDMAGKEAMSDGAYPIKDAEDLDNAIHAVGRGNADHDAIRKHIMARAKSLGLSSKIPDNWNADGSLQEEDALTLPATWQRRADERTFNDVRQLVQAAISDAAGPDYDGDGKYIYIVDMTEEWAVYQIDYCGDYLQVTYEVDDAGKVTLGNPVKVAQVTSYTPVGRSVMRPAEHRHTSYTGTHSHSHGSFDSQGDDATHDHSHTHDGDASHDHHASDDRSLRARAYAGNGDPLAELTAEALQSLRSQRADLLGSREIRSRAWKDAKCEIRSVPDGTGGSSLLYTGYASVFDAKYTITDWLGDYDEHVNRSAFDKTIALVEDRNSCDTAFLVNHEGMTLARTKSGTLKLSADSLGLHTEARLDPANYQVQALRSAVDREDIDEMSFAFQAIRNNWNEDYTDRELVEVSLNHGDVSAVNFGASSATAGYAAISERQARAFCAAIEKRAGASISGELKAKLTHSLSLASTGDTAMDELQVVLSEILGVPNPDIAQDAAMEPKGRRNDQSSTTIAPMDGSGECHCCANCAGSACDGDCCPDCGNASAASGGMDDQINAGMTVLAFDASDFDRRMRLQRLKRRAS